MVLYSSFQEKKKDNAEPRRYREIRGEYVALDRLRSFASLKMTIVGKSTTRTPKPEWCGTRAGLKPGLYKSGLAALRHFSTS